VASGVYGSRYHDHQGSSWTQQARHKHNSTCVERVTRGESASEFSKCEYSHKFLHYVQRREQSKEKGTGRRAQIQLHSLDRLPSTLQGARETIDPTSSKPVMIAGVVLSQGEGGYGSSSRREM
jgi:hypothetical protein